MQPIYFTIDQRLPVMVIPDANGHMDGHPVLTYTYSVFRNNQEGAHATFVDTDSMLAPDRKKDPSYLGTITFEQPGKLFTYTADGQGELSGDEVTEIIEQITHYRENPNLWAL